MKSTIFLFVWAICLPSACNSQNWREKTKVLKIQFAAHPTRSLYDSLHFIVTNHYLQQNSTERSSIRNALEKQAKWSDEKLCSDKERGTKITIKGRILDTHQQPIKNARLSIFHADNNGYYSPLDSVQKKMNEGDPRIFGYLTTDKLGNYAFQTIRPASYPRQYNGRTIPQHIHISVVASGYKSRIMQMVFDNDPALKDAYWRDWAKEQNFPIVLLQLGNDNMLYGIYDLVLDR